MDLMIPNSKDLEAFIGSQEKNFQDLLGLLRHVLEQNASIKQKLEDVETDLDGERTTLRQLRREKKQLHEQLNRLDTSGYHLILLDGDGMIFNGDLLRKGAAGGIEAAKQLKSLIPSSESSSTLPIHIRIFANLSELSRVALYNGLIPTRKCASDFFTGFNDSCNEHCFFVDVGYGKEMADHKIKTEIEYHLTQAVGCQSVILGASHDNGYARLLKDQKLSGYLEKITLLEGPPMERELRGLGLKVISNKETDGLLANLKLESPPKGWSSDNGSNSVNNNNSNPAATPPTPSGVDAKHSSSPSPSSSYATIASKVAHSTPPPSPPVPHRELHSFTNSTTRPPLKASRVGQTFYTQEDYQKIRNLDPKACINYYLRDHCGYGDKCYHEHSYDLNESELTALRSFVKNVQCKAKEDCYDADCVYGHPDRR